ncbi:methylamine utilization protein mauG [Nitrincola tibetensis]|uniref:Methylamine utilization protein MauG n=1 Tax=Nitrincola tibetensis TaxID=2219697 RepID=A0A364NK22_9GAMM|nr:cytochrome c peroxidase [Nitrincola tibetensis]RAU17237.1 methylamine utilization protein mauG [Nitrincola tibetensis]
MQRRVSITRVTILLALLLFVSLARAATDPKIEAYRQPPSLWPMANIDPGVEAAELAPLPSLDSLPEWQQLTPDKVVLGKQLFFERRLSASDQIACASCHDPDLGWADGRRVSIGHNRQQGDMNAPSIINSIFLNEVFWDGRAANLEEQVIASWSNPIEMAGDLEISVEKLSKIDGYSPLFEAAFGDPQVSVERIATAIASFMRSVNMNDTPYDRFLKGDYQALSTEQIRGLHLFRTKARCMNCHHGSLLSDQQYHHLGTSFERVGNSLGRYRITANADDMGAFRTPALRGISETAPYMHNGFARDLDMLLSLYNIGWWQNAALPDKHLDLPLAQLSSLIQPLELSKDEVAELKAFLLSLTGHLPYMKPPPELP